MVQIFFELYLDGCKKTEHAGAEIQQGLLDVDDFQLIFVPCGDKYFQTSTVALSATADANAFSSFGRD